MTENKNFLYRNLEAIQDNLFGVMIGIFAIGGLGTWTHQMYSEYRNSQLEMTKIKAGLEVKIGDYNGNQILDKFYEINGQRVPIEIDGRQIAEYFKK